MPALAGKIRRHPASAGECGKSPSRLILPAQIKSAEGSALFLCPAKITSLYPGSQQPRLSLCDLIRVTQIVVFDWLEVFVELIHQRYASQDVQFEDLVFTHVVGYFTSAQELP